MSTRTRLLWGALLAALTLSAALSTAQARRIETSEQHFLAIWEEAEKLTFEAIANIECKVTLEGSFHSRTISKVCGQLIGYVTNAQVARPCVGGNGWALNGVERLKNGMTTSQTLPWHIRYASFRGTLPRISGIRTQLVGAQFLIEGAGLGECLATTTAAKPAFGIIEVNETTGAVEGLRADESVTIPSITLAGLCPEGRFIRRARVFIQEPTGLNSVRITVRLVQ